MEDHYLAPNESMQLHELLTLKNISMTKSIAMSPLVSDTELKTILSQDVVSGNNHIRELRELLEHSAISAREVNTTK